MGNKLVAGAGKRAGARKASIGRVLSLFPLSWPVCFLFFSR